MNVVRWRRDAGHLVVDVVVPLGCTARVELPDSDAFEAPAGHHQFECSYRPADEDPAPPPRRSPLLEAEES